MNAFDLIALKQKVGEEYADEAALFVLIHFDAAKRGRCSDSGYNFISRHLCMAYFIGARLKSPQFMKMVDEAGQAWRKAGARPGQEASLTTGEYQVVGKAINRYLRLLPKLEAGTYRQAHNMAEQVIAVQP